MNKQSTLESLTSISQQLLSTTSPIAHTTTITTTLESLTQRCNVIGAECTRKLSVLCDVSECVVVMCGEMVKVEETLMWCGQCVHHLKPVGVDKEMVQQQINDMEVNLL